MNQTKQIGDCENCFKIKCKNCGWEPDKKELIQVQKGALVSCPVCNKPKE